MTWLGWTLYIRSTQAEEGRPKGSADFSFRKEVLAGFHNLYLGTEGTMFPPKMSMLQPASQLWNLELEPLEIN